MKCQTLSSGNISKIFQMLSADYFFLSVLTHCRLNELPTPGLEKLKNPNRSSIFSPQKRKLPNRFSVISVTVVCFHSVLFFSFKIQGASSLLAQRLTYQYCFNTCSININIGISIINSNFAPTVQTRHISSTFIFPISGSLSY